MKVGVAKETAPGETRVAVVPDTVRRLGDVGVATIVEQGAGEAATFSDSAYEEAGARIVSTDELYRDADVVCKVRKPSADEVGRLREGQALIALLQPLVDPEIVQTLAGRKVTAFSMDVIPRVTRAQPMDALSSQSTISGYKAAILAAEHLGKFFPMLTTAAGTIPPARVLVLGAGVAGLQAIATAKRLGAVVKAYDVRAAAAEEIRSMGALSIDLDLETLEGAGGYAREMTEDRAARQRDLLAPYIAAADALITTAAVPGRQAPMLVTAGMVEQMGPGSVVVDLAAESGGNVEGSVPGQVVRIGNAQVWGGANVPAQMPGPASRLYAQNIVNLVTLMTAASDDGAAFAPDFDDEIVAGSCVTHEGAIRHEPTRAALEGAQQ